ncbi:hypothetical protein CTAYLR_004802 [Chrysophaeum taylorii]|uniref:Translocator protein n=1 Tax=Chrysophaeum taylorii TaxID=2483200 RepID=A0AAD7XN13_9STRA|nr:hypothetical protein CTAYLR_004802 [Chrysophaeum taylorii]
MLKHAFLSFGLATALVSPFTPRPARGRARAVPTCSALPWVVGCVASGTVGVPFVGRAIDSWYTTDLAKPKWTPNNRIFAPTWTLLYALLGLAASRVASVKGALCPELRLALAHHALNLLWAPVFFGLRALRAGVLINGILLASLGVIIPSFSAAAPGTAPLLYPYVAWLVFATALNIQICRLNPNGVQKASSP